MIRINATESNEMIFTLREKAVGLTAGPFYTFVITNKDSYQGWTFSPENNSTSPYYDSFSFSISATESLTYSVSLDLPVGEYEYKVYETLNKWDLSLSNVLGVVEVGLFMVSMTPSTINSYDAGDVVKVFREI